MALRLQASLDHYAAEDPNDTGLRFTDILFGFALREVVIRFARYQQLSPASRIHLVLAAVTILGSYIGFRNSQKRGKFRLRFFNLATIRFFLDQGMVFLYFWLALYLSTDKTSTGDLSLPTSQTLLRFDAKAIVAIFALYLLWDLTSHWMAASGRYFEKWSDDSDERVSMSVPFYRTAITILGLFAAAVVLLVAETAEPAGNAAQAWMIALIALLVIYRFLKDSLVND